MMSYSEELGLDLAIPEDRFKWFLASMLFAKRISAEIAKRTYSRFEEEGLSSPKRIIDVGWERLVQVLDSGGYVRYDFSTASNLLEAMEKLENEYGGLERLHEWSKDGKDLEKRLKEFKGIGPVGVNIFLRELRGIWDKADPAPSKMAVKIAQKINFRDVKCHESALVRINLEHCKTGECDGCPVKKYCKNLK